VDTPNFNTSAITARNESAIFSGYTKGPVKRSNYRPATQFVVSVIALVLFLLQAVTPALSESIERPENTPPPRYVEIYVDWFDTAIKRVRLWLDDARSQHTGDIASKVVVRSDPFSENNFDHATDQFNALKLAVESKNQLAINSLTDGAVSRQALFDELFSNFTRLEVRIIEPSAAYQDTELTINGKRDGSWSRILW